MVDLNSEAVPLTLYGAALAGKPFVPMNYRLTDEQLRGHLAGPLRPSSSSARAWPSASARSRASSTSNARSCSRSPPTAGGEQADPYGGDPEPSRSCCTRAGPRASRRRRCCGTAIWSPMSLDGRVRRAGQDEAALISVPPYHIAGIAAVLSRCLRRPSRGLHAAVLAGRVGVRRPRPRDHPRDDRSHHARPHPRRAGRARAGTAVACVTSPTAAARSGAPSSSGRWRCCRTSTSSTPTG